MTNRTEVCVIVDKNDKMIAIGLAMLLTAGLVYWFSTVTIQSKDFEVSNAKYYTDFDETSINLTYRGTSPVNVSIYYEFYFNGEKMNQTIRYGIMKKGDFYMVGFHGYVTWCEVIYDGNRIRITFTPKHTTVSESSP